jgi:hypothetical protein
MAPPAELTIGLLGTGKIGSAVVTGFCSDGGWQPKHVTVSARTKAKADALVAKFPARVSIGATNQEIIDQSDVIFVGLLPNVAKEELPKLTFAPHKRVVSMMATIPYDELVALVQLPRENVVRTVPLTSASKRSGPILAYPVNEFARDLLSQIGTPVMVASESEITTLVRARCCFFHSRTTNDSSPTPYLSPFLVDWHDGADLVLLRDLREHAKVVCQQRRRYVLPLSLLLSLPYACMLTVVLFR